MANNIKWIKMKVGMFDGLSFRRIKSAKLGGASFRDKLTAVWFELMDFAARCGNNGRLTNPSEVPYRDLNDIALMIDRDGDELKACMTWFVNEGMIEIVDDMYKLSHWELYQNRVDEEVKREKNRIRQAEHRKRITESQNETKQLNTGIVTRDICDMCDTVCDSVTSHLEERRREENRKEETRREREENTPALGRFQNVLLSGEEQARLKKEFPDWKAMVDRLSVYMASTGKTYDSHYATLLKWAQEDKEKEAAAHPVREYGDPEEFYR